MADALVGVLAACAVLLAGAGLAKLLRPLPAVDALDRADIPGLTVLARVPLMRLVGLAEIAVAVAVLGPGGRWPAVLLAGCYAALAVVAWQLAVRTPGADCGCFGAAASPLTGWHVVVNLVGVAVGVLAAVLDPPSWWSAVTTGPVLDALLLTAAVLLLAWLLMTLMTALPALLRRLSEPDRMVANG
ncbi:MauE/DoxX family redox-associated membrane protein [Nakamurella leprariae]|nr:MauE/DoxX family redox-associated membrane protein [Nakamurella leprariae]